MNTYNIVTTKEVLKMIKSSSKYFKLNLGFAVTSESNSSVRTYNKKDEFAYFYNSSFKANLILEGNIGNISIYTDFNIQNNKLVFFYKNENFVFDYEIDVHNQKGADFLLGKYIRTMETDFADKLKAKEEEAKREAQEQKRTGDPNKVFTNPGHVTYEDIVAYMEKQRLERLKV